MRRLHHIMHRAKEPNTAMPVNYAGLAILFNILGLAGMFANPYKSPILFILMLFLGNLLMFIGYFYILKRDRKW